MKKFLVKTISIFTSVLLLFMCFNIVYYKVGTQARMVAFEVYDAIDITKEKNDCLAVVLGDSVARQFFNPNRQQELQRVCCLTTNQAIMPVGNYILLQEYLENNPQTEMVYYIARPDSFCSEINFHYTYSYFVTPLYTKENKMLLDDATIVVLKRKFGDFFIEKNFAKWMLAKYPKMLELYSDTCEAFNQLRQRQGKEEDNTTVLYLYKIKELCEEKGVELHILSTPVPENYEFDINMLKVKMQEYGMDEFYQELQESIYYVEQDEFVDGVHLKDDYIQNNKKRTSHILVDYTWE